jgi:hypothetical protein
MQHDLPLDKDLVRGGCGGLASRLSILFQNSRGESEERHKSSKFRKTSPLPHPFPQTMKSCLGEGVGKVQKPKRQGISARTVANAHASVTCNYMLVYLLTI